MKFPRMVVRLLAVLVGVAAAAAAALVEWRAGRRLPGKAVVAAFLAGNYGFFWLADKLGWIEDETLETPVLPAGGGDLIENIPITPRHPPRIPPQG
jgi:hypothetical protein